MLHAYIGTLAVIDVAVHMIIRNGSVSRKGVGFVGLRGVGIVIWFELSRLMMKGGKA